MNWLGTFFAEWFGPWFGAGETPPGAMSASLSGSGTLGAALTSTGEAIPPESSGGGGWGPFQFIRRIVIRYAASRSARLTGRGHATGTLTATPWPETTAGRNEEEAFALGLF